ncbi:MAG: TIGR00730 family Rossman fold protein, partial [Burkholderiales bacterium]
MNNICIFCGSNTGRGDAYADAARAMVRTIAAAGHRIVFGGGKVGLMGVVAEAAIASGAYVIGVTPRRLLEHEVVHTGLSELHVADSMHERKVMMASRADAFIVLPGGMGTFDEMFEILTLTQLGVHEKPCGLLNVNGFYAPLMAFLDRAVEERFVRAEH